MFFSEWQSPGLAPHANRGLDQIEDNDEQGVSSSLTRVDAQ